MPLLIDGHNLIGQMRNLTLADPDDEERLVERLTAYRRRRRIPITVVFDAGAGSGLGQGYEWGGSGIRVLFARPGQRADDVICRLIREAPDRKGYTVVTSDRAVQGEVRRWGATVVPAQDFARQLDEVPVPRPPDKKEMPPSPKEVERWLEIFGEYKGKGKRKTRSASGPSTHELPFDTGREDGGRNHQDTKAPKTTKNGPTARVSSTKTTQTTQRTRRGNKGR